MHGMTEHSTIRIAMWSGPRNISTAMMRAFENRADAEVWDEPFYAWYLAETKLDHPMADEVIAAGLRRWQDVAEQCVSGSPAPVFYQKHMTQHMLPEVDLGWLSRVTNAFLIREPEAVLASYHDRRADPTMADVGFDRQSEIFDRVAEALGQAPPVLDSDDVLSDPEGNLRKLCAALGIGFDPAMLSWPAGRRESDGVWAPHWYASVEASTGFGKPREPRPLPDHLRALAESCRPHYDRLAAHRL